MIFNPSQTYCFFCECCKYPGPTNLENTSEGVFTDNAMENITFKQWILAERYELVTSVKLTEEFVQSLLEKLLLLLCHSFIAALQAVFLREM
jgi:hypothetical protein